MIYDVYGRTESSRIYLAKPGKIMVGCLNGVNADSCGLTLNLLNTHELQFDIYRYHDEEPTNYYDDVDILMELYVDGFGWFVIDESPAIHNDGIKEYKSVAAKSYENTLHQYDLVSFDINTASPTSREMMATDNVYSLSESSDTWYNFSEIKYSSIVIHHNIKHYLTIWIRPHLIRILNKNWPIILKSFIMIGESLFLLILAYVMDLFR